MASTEINGAATADGMSAAERLMQKHASEEVHTVQVEEVPDEEFLAHPPPSGIPAASDSAPAPTSSKAAGKQPARESKPSASTKPALDTQSEELFPALGAPKAAAAAAPSMWSKKPAAVAKAANGVSNGVTNGTSAAPRSSAPSSGLVTPSTTAGSQRGPTPTMTLPGRYSEQIKLHSSMLTPRNQLKKPVAEVLRDINKSSKATVVQKSGPGGIIIFEGSGPVDAVRIALKEVANVLCAKQTIRVPIPVSVRGKIVGKQGATIKAISTKTGAKINISKQEAAEVLEEDDMDATVDVQIEGDPFAVEMAKQDIEKIVSENTSSANTRLKHIPAEFYPFLHQQRAAIQGGRNSQMQIPSYYTWDKEAPAQNPASFTPRAGLPISLSGDRQAVAEIRAEIDRQVQQLQRQLEVKESIVERGRHQFIFGDRGTSLNDFVKDTGCSVILPPDNDDSETIYIIGPSDNLSKAEDRILDLASSMAVANLDIAKQFGNGNPAKMHAAAVTRYLQQQQAIKQLERTHNASIVPDAHGPWNIYAPDNKATMKARADLMSLVNGHPPSRFHPVQVDPFYHDHIREQAARQIRDNHGVRVVIPDGLDESQPVLLVYEDRAPSPDYQFPRGVPQAAEVKGFQQALQDAQKEIMALMSGNAQIVSQDVEAPTKFHDKIRRHVDRHHQSIGSGQIPVQVKYGGPQSAARRAPGPNVALRGPQDSVDALLKSLLPFIEQEKQDELERGFTLTFDFPQQHANHLIGKRGENINRLREEFDVEIQLNDGKCEIKGPEAKANACKKHVLELAKKFEDETTHHLHVPAQYHRDLIGAGGAQVNRLQDRYHVRVNFPRNKQASDEDGADEASKRGAQQPNEVIIKGPSRGADSCRDELLSLLQYVKDNSHTATVSVAQNQLPSLIGSQGREMEALRLETGAQIDVPGSKDAASPSGRAEIKIKGSKKAVEDAKKLIEEKAKVFDNTVTRNLDVERKHHRLIIGSGGSNLRNIIVQAGGPEDQRLHNRMIRFPKTDVEGNTIRVEGQKSVVDGICAAIEALVLDQESQTTEIVEVKPEKHRLLIGRQGETRRQLEQQFSVQVNVPRQSETGPQRSQVRIQGKPENVEKAKAHILELTKDMEGETVQVPRRFHHVVADNGQFFRRLRNDHKVTVDHNGQRPPPKPTAPAPSRANGGALPLITDDPSAGGHSWESHSLHTSAEEGDIPWALSGPTPEAVAGACAKLQRALEEASKQDTTGFLILPDPRTYRYVIGQGGSEINRIRKKTGTKITVPKDQNQGEAIEITGNKAGVEEARDIILEIVQNNT